MNQNIISINNIDMYYEIHGTGSPLLMLHGFTCSSAGLADLFAQLKKTNQLIIPDLRGHGQSTNSSNEFTFRQAALDLFALLDHLKINHCSAVGFSGGGCALLQMAYQQPGRITSMAIVSAVPYFPQQARDIMREVTVEGKTEADWDAMRKIHFHGDEQIKSLWRQAAAFSESYDDMNLTPELLAQIMTKTFIVQGDRDPFYPIDLTIEMFKSLQDAYLWIIPNGGHVPLSSDNIMQQFLNSLVEFL